MNFKEYVIEAKRTEIKRDYKMRLFHGIIGVSSELSELYTAIVKDDKTNILEEIGDMFWYMAILADSLDAVDLLSNLFESYKPREEMEYPKFGLYVITVTYSHFSNHLKRSVFYGSQEDKKNATDMLITLAYRLADFSTVCDCEPVAFLEANIAKLKARYPEKWSKAACLGRNIGNEIKALEGGTA